MITGNKTFVVAVVAVVTVVAVASVIVDDGDEIHLRLPLCVARCMR